MGTAVTNAMKLIWTNDKEALQPYLLQRQSRRLASNG
jgi:hypothetical protein